MDLDLQDVQEKMAHRLKLSKGPLCVQCELDAMMYGSALHHEEKGHIPFDEAVKIIVYIPHYNDYHYKNFSQGSVKEMLKKC